MPNLSERKPADRFHGLIYGQSGAGKTHLIGTFPDPYIIDTDYGLETLVGRDIEFDEFYARAGEDAAKIMWPAILAKVEEFIKSPPHATLAVDSLTTLMDVAAAFVLSKTGRTTLQLQDYTPLYDEITKLVVRLRRVPANVVITAHEESIRDENTGKLQIVPLVMGNKFGPKLPIFFTNIMNCVVDYPKTGVKTADRYLLVQSDGTRLAKSQVTSDATRIAKSYSAIVEYLNSGE